MKLEITRENKIKDIQASFAQKFPFLKLEFFSRVDGNSNSLFLKRLLPSNLKVGDIEGFTDDGTIDITPSMTVAELESLFTSRFRLLVQVFRKSGNVWLETTMTDKWTLKRQNEHGREISSEPVTIVTPAEDFDLNRDPD